MKISAIIIGLFAVVSVSAQSILPKVFVWDNSAVTKTKSGTSRQLFSGSGAILSQHEMNGISLNRGKAISYQSSVSGTELFIIIKSGPVTIELNNKKTEIDRGSVIVVLPGDKVTIENTGMSTAEFYQMMYHSIAAPNEERGRKAGESFVMNWKDMVFKPTDKGGVRQLFDRQTTMLNRFDIHVTQLNEGNKSHEPHQHKNEEIILMLEGNAEMQIGTDHQKANPGDVVFLTSNVLHNLTNVGKSACLYFAIQWN